MSLKPRLCYSGRSPITPHRSVRVCFERALSTQGRNRNTTLQSSNGDVTGRSTVEVPLQNTSTTTLTPRPLKSLPLPALLRTFFLGKLFASPALSSLGMNILGRIAHSRSPFLDPDRNIVLGSILRAVVYNQFCGGNEKQEIVPVLDRLRQAGYAGVILQWAREIVAHGRAETDSKVTTSAEQIQTWLDGNLKGLSFVGRDDYYALKYTGAGSSIAEALRQGQDPPPQFRDALHTILRAAQAQGTRIFLDAEQQVFQTTIDRWSVDLMREYNVNGEVLVLNTYQAYLKATRAILRNHLQLAQQEGWALGVKLVRGAYIQNDIRSRIHDTKADTDASYNGIVHSLLSRSFDDIKPNHFPKVRTFLAGHNAESIFRAAQLHQTLVLQGHKPDTLEFGQLYGMADHISGMLLQQVEDAKKAAQELSGEAAELQRQAAPRIMKCVNWGSVRECLHFLMRRAAENQGSADRLRDGFVESKRELWLRFRGL